MDIKTYDESDLTRQKGPNYFYGLIVDLPGDNPDLFGDMDNNDMAGRLKEKGVVGNSDSLAPEPCCFYIYFLNLKAGREFLKKLNVYITDKARMVSEARAY